MRPENLRVILDLDGTLIDSEALACRAWTEAIGGLGYPFSRERFLQMLAMNKAALERYFQEEYNESFPFPACWAAYDAARQRILEEEGVPVKPGVRELVMFLQTQEIPYCVATSSPTELARARLRAAGINDLFPLLLGGESVTRGKPDPEIFLLAAQRLQAGPADCVVVEDSAPGVRAAAAAAMTVLLVPDLQPPTEELRRLATVLPDLLAVRDWLAHARAPVQKK